MSRMSLRNIVTLFAVVLVLSCDEPEVISSDGGEVTQYQTLADPGRGFYKHSERRDFREPGLDSETLKAWREEGTTLVLRVFYLGEFIDSPINDAYLEMVAKDFEAMKTAGVKGIVRFAYSARMEDAERQQAGEAWVLGHLRQLAPVLHEHAEMIHCVQAGFLGAWGEWHAVHPDFLAGDGSLDPEVCRRFMSALLDAVPEPIFVQVRTPRQKMMLFDQGDPRASRVGHHNDCFLASEDDYGTYRDVDGETLWLAEETKLLPMGGETCGVFLPRSSGKSAMRELARFHYNYLNSDYHPAVLKGWRKDGTYDEIECRLGHRIKCVEVRVDGDKVLVSLTNEGYARPVYDRPMQYRWADDSEAKSVDFSVRDLAPGEIGVVELPMEDGRLELRWPDRSPELADRGDFALCLANPEIPRDDKGWHQIEIQHTP